jgi:hypothetical protein
MHWLLWFYLTLHRSETSGPKLTRNMNIMLTQRLRLPKSPAKNVLMLSAELTAQFSGLTMRLLAAAIAFLVSMLVVRWRRQASRIPPGYRYPPCMPSVPIVGSLPFMEKDVNQMPRFLMEQTSRYGNMFALYLGPR